MNAFIHASNQSTLWKVVNNVGQVQQYFANAPPGAKEKWFQTHIGQIYQMYYGKQEALQTLNKKAIDIMLSSLQHVQMQPSQMHPSQMQPSQMHPSQMHPSQMQPSQMQPTQVQPPSQTIKSTTMDEFTRRQAEYDAMVTKHTPVANFSEPFKDDAIIDLNLAVEQYKKQREPLQDESISLQVEEIDINDQQQSTLRFLPNNKKQVQWGPNQEHDHFETRITNAIQHIEQELLKLNSSINDIKKYIMESKPTVSRAVSSGETPVSQAVESEVIKPLN